jgi:protein-S-isoprenylcysteine O-methyltransferase Ste14
VRWFLEERALVKSLGEEYRDYQKQVGAFLPKIALFLKSDERYSHD